jgi:hypothetical protein
MVVCPKCHGQEEEGKKFCGSCGNPLSGADSGPNQESLGSKQEEKAQGGLICPNCKRVYEWGTFCATCGATLGTQPSSPTDPGDSQPSSQTEAVPEPSPSTEVESPTIEGLESDPFVIEETPRKRLVCPSCKIIYEGRDTCVRCGAILVEHSPSPPQKQEPPPAPEKEQAETEDKEETVGLELDRIEEGLRPSPLHESLPDPVPGPPPLSLSQDKTDEDLDRLPGKKTAEGRTERKVIVPRKKKINLRRLPLEALSILILVIAGGYLLWSFYSHVIAKKPKAASSLSKTSGEPVKTEALTPGPAVASSDPLPSVQSPPAESQEIEEIKSLLETIRKANLEKDIDLFMSCYGPEFKGREGKRKDVLETWKNFNYLDLSFNLTKESVAGATAQARVEWVSKTSSTKRGTPQESRSLLDVSFQKEENKWRIKATKFIE